MSARSRSIVTALVIPVSFFVLALFGTPFARTVELDPDEGVNLMKAALYANGYPLYAQVGSDQPPLMTAMLATALRVFGRSTPAARVVVLVFAALLVGCFQQTLSRTLGALPAIGGTLLLIVSWTFLSLSVSVMIGMVSLSLAMGAIYASRLYQQTRGTPLLVLSACLMGLSLQTKLFSALLVPLIAWDLLGGPARRDRRGPAIWLGALTGTFLFVGLAFHSLDLDLLTGHVGPQVRMAFPRDPAAPLTMVRHDLPALLAAVFGVAAVVLGRMRVGVLPLTWLVLAWVALSLHTPVWPHQYLLLSIPLCWLAAHGVAMGLEALGWTRRDPAGPSGDRDGPGTDRATIAASRAPRMPRAPRWAAAIVLLTLAIVPIRAFVEARQAWERRGVVDPEWGLVERLGAHGAATHWVFTDRPILAFDAGLLVPPEMAVLTEKRWRTGRISVQDLRKVLSVYRPEQLLVGRRLRSLTAELVRDVDARYVLVHDDGAHAHYLARELAAGASPEPAASPPRPSPPALPLPTGTEPREIR